MKNKPILFALAGLCGAAAPLLGQFVDEDVEITAIYGSGNSADHWTSVFDSQNGIELALRAKTRFVGPIQPTGNVYTTQTGISDGANALWNFDFHISVFGDPQSSSGSPLDLFEYRISLDFDRSNTTNWLVTGDPLTGDNYYGDISTPSGGGVERSAPLPSDTIVQNSQNYGFIQTALGPLIPTEYTFDPFQTGTYTIRLEAFNFGEDDPLASVEIEVVAVPEPSTMALLGVGSIACLLWLRRRRRL